MAVRRAVRWQTGDGERQALPHRGKLQETERANAGNHVALAKRARANLAQADCRTEGLNVYLTLPTTTSPKVISLGTYSSLTVLIAHYNFAML